MAWPKVQINQLNQLQGETKEVERSVLYIGYGTVNTGKILPVNVNSDLDEVFGKTDTQFKNNVRAAMLNAGQNWSGFVAVITNAADWVKTVLDAQSIGSFESICFICNADKATINQAAELRQILITKFGRWTWFILAVNSLDSKETWDQSLTRLTSLQKGIVAPAVQLVPIFYGNEPGVLAGRLCNRAVTIADSPARVKTGALIAIGSDDTPIDAEKRPLDLAMLQALEQLRYNVPMWYPDYDGLYWSDGRTLDVEGGDYQVIEYLRVVDKAARRIRLLALAKIGDRELNSSPLSIIKHQQYFARPLREMAKNSQINGIVFPGEVKPPADNAVTITWITPTKVQIYIVVRPYECPKDISVGIMLDTSLESK